MLLDDVFQVPVVTVLGVAGLRLLAIALVIIQAGNAKGVAKSISDKLSMGGQSGGEVGRRETQYGGQSRHARLVIRQQMGLFVLPVLQKMLDAAQKAVGLFELLARFGGNQSCADFGMQRL